MYSFAKKSDADVVSFKIRCNTSEDGKQLTFVEHKQPRLDPNTVLIDDSTKLAVANIDDMQSIEKSIPYKNTLTWRTRKVLARYRFPWEIWLKFSKRNFLLENKLFFLEDVYNGEDQIWTYGLFMCAKKMIHVPKVLYHHRIAEGSIVRTNRTPAQNMNLWVATFTSGIKWVDNVMSRLDFFKQRPEFRYEVLEAFCRRYSIKILNKVRTLPQGDIYKAIRQEFGEAWGNYDVLLASLITYMNAQQKEIAVLEKSLKECED